MRQIELILRTPVASVGYCHVEEGCKLATPKIHDANGIARVNDTFYVANSVKGSVTVLERQTDNTLVLTDVIQTSKLICRFCNMIYELKTFL
jgi:arylesterase / paraoxonase